MLQQAETQSRALPRNRSLPAVFTECCLPAIIVRWRSRLRGGTLSKSLKSSAMARVFSSLADTTLLLSGVYAGIIYTYIFSSSWFPPATPLGNTKSPVHTRKPMNRRIYKNPLVHELEGRGRPRACVSPGNGHSKFMLCLWNICQST